MIVSDGRPCGACAQCRDACPMTCIGPGPRGPIIRRESCVSCGRCAAACPRAILSWLGEPGRFVRREILPAPMRIEELFKSRRSAARFLAAPVPPADLDRIAAAAADAPREAAHLELVILTDPKTIADLDGLVLDRLERVYERVYARPLVFAAARRLFGGIDGVERAKTRAAIRRGRLIAGAPAVVLLIGFGRRGRDAAAAPYALYNMILLAEALGLATRLAGSAARILDRRRAARRRLGLDRRRRVLGVLLVGRPDFEFPRVIEGRRLPVRRFAAAGETVRSSTGDEPPDHS